MSLNGLVNNRLKQSDNSLKQVSTLADYLLEDVWIRIKRTGIEPVYETETALLSVSTTVEQATSTQITDSDIFLNSVSKELNNKIYDVLGRSPGFIEDIAKAVVKPVKDIVKNALKPIQKAIKSVIDNVHSTIDNAVSFIQGGFDNAAKTITTWVDDGFKAIGEGVTFIQSTVNNLLEGVVNIFDWFILVFQNAFKGLTDGLTHLLSFEVEDVMKLTDTMTKQFTDKQTETLKKQAGMG